MTGKQPCRLLGLTCSISTATAVSASSTCWRCLPTGGRVPEERIEASAASYKRSQVKSKRKAPPNGGALSLARPTPETLLAGNHSDSWPATIGGREFLRHCRATCAPLPPHSIRSRDGDGKAAALTEKRSIRLLLSGRYFHPATEVLGILAHRFRRRRRSPENRLSLDQLIQARPRPPAERCINASKADRSPLILTDHRAPSGPDVVLVDR